MVLKDDRGMSFEEIGSELGISYQRAAAICATAMTKFREGVEARGYRAEDFLDRICKWDNQGSEKLR